MQKVRFKYDNSQRKIKSGSDVFRWGLSKAETHDLELQKNDEQENH